jgi:hypothetical protein
MKRSALDARLRKVVGETKSAEIIDLARVLGDEAAVSKALDAGPPSLPPLAVEGFAPSPQVIKIDYRDARAAGGTASSVFNGELVRQAIMACARPGEPDFDDKAPFVVEAMREIAPRNALEAMRGSLAVAADLLALSRKFVVPS